MKIRQGQTQAQAQDIQSLGNEGKMRGESPAFFTVTSFFLFFLFSRLALPLPLPSLGKEDSTADQITAWLGSIQFGIASNDSQWRLPWGLT